ncbi:MAG: VanZ family protein [Spirochaetaceae bacterium]|jgi:hypothetical protein|nr:VanZ family protein [Spirochaetaceae bacterium]
MEKINTTKKEALLKNVCAVLIHLPGPLILAASFYLSSLPTIHIIEDANISDKLIHFVCFAGLTGAWSWWWTPKAVKTRPIRSALITICAVSLYGIIDEFHQSFTPGRECSALDWLADTLGAVLGVSAGFWSMRVFPKIKPLFSRKH